MKDERKVPAIRFKGFSDDWEQRKLGDITSSLSGSGLNKDLLDENGKYECILYGHLYTDYGMLISQVKYKTNYVPVSVVYSEKGDVLIPSSDTTPTGLARASSIDKYGVILGGDINILRPIKNEINGNYLSIAINKNKCELIKLIKGTTVRHIHTTDLKNVELIISLNKDEQEKIFRLFKNIDTLITLHQCKLDKLKNVKKALLEKMFPAGESSVPKLRFKGFTDDWEQRKQGEIFDFLHNNTMSRNQLNIESGVAKNVHYGDILIKYEEVISAEKLSSGYISDLNIVNKFKASLLAVGDVVFADTAEDETVGKCTEVSDIGHQKVISGLHTIPCRPHGKFACGFLGFSLNAPAFHNQLLPLMQGIKVTSISKSALKDTIICYPKSVKEQKLIGNTLQAVNTLITLHQRKLDKLKNIKKALLDKMFI